MFKSKRRERMKLEQFFFVLLLANVLSSLYDVLQIRTHCESCVNFFKRDSGGVLKCTEMKECVNKRGNEACF